MSWPRSSHQEPRNTKKRKVKRNEERIRNFEEFVRVQRDANIRLELEGYDVSTGLPKGVTQDDFDKANEDFRKNKSQTACSEVECQPVTIA